jgi:hypothetical protein
MAEELFSAGELQRTAPGLRVKVLIIVLTDDRCATVGDVGNVLAEGIGQHVVTVAQQARGDVGIAGGIVGVIAIGHRLPIVAEVHHARQGKRRCEVVRCIERDRVDWYLTWNSTSSSTAI